MMDRQVFERHALLNRYQQDVWQFAEWEAPCCGCICTRCEDGHAWQVERNKHHPECNENYFDRHLTLHRYDKVWPPPQEAAA